MSMYNCINIVQLMEWQSTWIRGGKIDEVAWIDRDVIAWYSGAHVVFFHLINGKQSLFPCSQYHDGVCCIAGHSTMHLVVFAEKSRNPKILVYSYPLMTKVSECCGGTESGYLAIAFGSAKYLVSLGSCPTYPIIIWNWNNGDKLSFISTPIHDVHGQMIRVCPSKPMLIAQLGKDSKTLLIWNVTATRNIVMSHEQVILPNEACAVYVDWYLHENDPRLVIADEHGNVYISNRHASEINRIVLSQRCGVCLDYEMPIVCWFQDGIILKTTFCQIRYYKKNEENNWRRERYIETKLKPYILTRNPFKMDEIFYFTEEGFMMQMNLSITADASLTVDRKFQYGGIYKFIDFIYPWAHDLVTMDIDFNLNIVDVVNGEIVGMLRIETEGKVTQLLSHPDYPLLVVITTSGELFVITVNKRYDPSVLQKYRLQTEQLDILKFSQCGQHLMVGEKTSGICFCITHVLKNGLSRIYQLEIRRPITDIVLYDDAGVINIMVLILSPTIAFAGDYIFTYELTPNAENFTQTKIITHLPALYQSIHYTPKNIDGLTATPYLSRQIHYFKRTSGMRIELIGAAMTGHHIGGLKIHTNRRYITTSGIDGVVTISKGQPYTENPIILLTHHRADSGVSDAICSPSGSLLIALGRNGAIICMELKFNGKSHFPDKVEREKIISCDYAKLHESILAFLSGPYQVIPSGIENVTTWMEWRYEQILIKEEEICRVRRLAIKEKFNAIKTKIQEMLNGNERCEESGRLPVAAFDLAILAREQKIKLAREEREDVRLQLEFECLSMRKVTEWIKTTFWDPQSTLPKSIFSIFSDYQVTNYPTIPEDPQEKEMIVRSEYFRDLKTKIEAKHLSLELKRCLMIKNRYKPCRSDEKSVLESLLVDDEEYDDEEEKKREHHACEGVTTYRFIQPSSQYSQFQDYNFSQFLSMTHDIVHDVQQLKNYFNNLFEKMYDEKRQVVALFCARNEKNYHIDTELKLLFNQSVSEILPNPEWRSQEYPNSIIHVSDDEVMAKPYISLSQQRHANNKVDEEKRIKSQLMTDEFYEETLLAIMDGVLEVRWVDIIKKDISKPQCMVTKLPDQYNVEDIVVVEKYDNDVQILMKEREKYRRILETDSSKITTILRENVDKFNLSLGELSLMKMKVESAIQQLNLLRARGYLRALHQLTILDDINSCKQKIAHNEQRIAKIIEENNILRALLPDLQSQRDVLLNEEKMMVNQFKMEFRSVGKIAMDILRKQFRRRPKLSMKHAAADDLLEIGRCVITCDKSKFTRRFCAEYLAEVDDMDVWPTDMLDSVTSHYWFHMVKIRRNKIELEMRLKANWREINEIERGITNNNERIEKLKCDIFELEDQLSRTNQMQLELYLNTEIQLILKMEQIEINLNGLRNDTAHSILLPRHKIIKINDRILNVGDEKLKAMKQTMKFSRGRLFKEWQHKCLKMKIANLQDDLREIKNFPVTKNLRAHLSRQAMGLKNDKNHEQLNRQIQAMEMTLDRSLKESIEKSEVIDAKIDKVRRDNHALDEAITRMNVDRWELELERDLQVEDRCRELSERKMHLILHRSKLVSKIQQQYLRNLALQTDYELCQLKRRPVLSSFTILGDECD